MLEKIFWKNDKERIKQFIKEIPSKYLLGRYRSSKKLSIDGFDSSPHVWSLVTVNWKGFTFSVSRKTLQKELWERKDIKLIRLNPYSWNSKYFVIPKPKKIKKEKNIKKR